MSLKDKANREAFTADSTMEIAFRSRKRETDMAEAQNSQREAPRKAQKPAPFKLSDKLRASAKKVNPEFSFSSFLTSTASQSDLRKGDKTVVRLKLCTCQLLETTRLTDLKIQDVCAGAGIAQGTFYLYFSDRQALLNAILKEFVEFLRARMIRKAETAASHEESVRGTTMEYYRLFENNAGLMKCIISYFEDFPEISQIASENNKAWIALNVRSALKRMQLQGKANTVSEPELYRRYYAVGAMVDQYLSYLFLTNDPHVLEVSRDAEEVVDTLCYLWNKAVSA